MNWIETHPELAITLAGAIFGCVGYYFRARREKQENLKEALYLLAEIWYRNTLAFNVPIQRMFDVLCERLRQAVPDADFTDDQEAATRAYFMPILEKTMRLHALDGIESLYGAYERVVHLISRSDPVFAYDLDAASSTKRRLAFLDQYFGEAFQPLDSEGGASKAFADALRKGLTAETEKDVTQELEKHLRKLAVKLGVATWARINIRIVRRRKLLKEGPDFSRVDSLLQDVLIPAVQASNQSFKPTSTPPLRSDANAA